MSIASLLRPSPIEHSLLGGIPGRPLCTKSLLYPYHLELKPKLTLEREGALIAEVDLSLHITIISDVKPARSLRRRKKEPSLLASGMVDAEQLVHVCPKDSLVALQLLAVSLALQQSRQVRLAQFARKLDEDVVVAQLGRQRFDDVDDLVEVGSRAGDFEEALVSLLAQLRYRVFIRCGVDVEPEAPWGLLCAICAADDAGLNGVDVAEDEV